MFIFFIRLKDASLTILGSTFFVRHPRKKYSNQRVFFEYPFHTLHFFFPFKETVRDLSLLGDRLPKKITAVVNCLGSEILSPLLFRIRHT